MKRQHPPTHPPTHPVGPRPGRARDRRRARTADRDPERHPRLPLEVADYEVRTVCLCTAWTLTTRRVTVRLIVRLLPGYPLPSSNPWGPSASSTTFSSRCPARCPVWTMCPADGTCSPPDVRPSTCGRLPDRAFSVTSEVDRWFLWFHLGPRQVVMGLMPASSGSVAPSVTGHASGTGRVQITSPARAH